MISDWIKEYDAIVGDKIYNNCILCDIVYKYDENLKRGFPEKVIITYLDSYNKLCTFEEKADKVRFVRKDI